MFNPNLTRSEILIQTSDFLLTSLELAISLLLFLKQNYLIFFNYIMHVISLMLRLKRKKEKERERDSR